MLYGPLWRVLPGPVWAKALQCLVLLLAVVAICFLWLFPRIAPIMPFNDNTVDGSVPTAPPPASTTPAPSTPATSPSTTSSAPSPSGSPS